MKNRKNKEFTPQNILLADIETLKRESYLDDNVSSEVIRTAMLFVQDSIVERVTGSCLMNQIKLLIDHCEIDERRYRWYKELLDSYLFQIIVYGIQSDLTTHLTFKERNQGVIRNNDTNVQYPVLSDIKHVERKYNTKLDFYINRAVNWLRCNKEHFCELCGCCCCCDCNTAPFNKPYRVGINLDIVSDNNVYVYGKKL